MRHLHPVGVQEKFTASGVYVHFQDSQPTGTVEHWSIHELPDGAQMIRVDDDWRETDGSSVLIEAWRSPPAEGNRVERFDIHAFGGKNDQVKEVRATFQFHPTHAEVGRSVDKEFRQQFELELPEHYIVAPESLIFGGFEVAQMAVNPGHIFPIVSYLPTFLNPTAAFRPVIHEQCVVFLSDETILVDGKAYISRCYEQQTPSTKQRWPIWIDEYGILLKFTSPDERHSAVLTRYARRVEPQRPSS